MMKPTYAELEKKVAELITDAEQYRTKAAAFHAGEERYRTILESIAEGYFEVDLAGNLRFFNQALCHITGYDAETLMGMNNREFTTPETAEKMFQVFNQVFQTGKPVTIMNFEIVRGDGGKRDVELSTYLMKDSDGHPIGFRGVSRDVTERKAAEKALLESEERFRRLHEASFGGIGIHEKGVILDANQALAEMTGYDFQELLGMNGLLLIAEEWREFVMEKIVSGYPHPYDVFGVRKDGSRYPLEIRGKNIPYHGRMARVTEFRDITWRKRAEEELAKARAQLQQSQKMEAVGTLAGGIAHDFNNILAAITGYTELAALTIEPEGQAHAHLQKVLKACERASGLVKQILTFSRQTDQDKHPIRMGLIVKEALKLLRAFLPSTIDVRQTVLESTAMVMADPIQVHQIMMNICTNAAHAMEAGGGVIDVTLSDILMDEEMTALYPELKPGLHSRLVISDTGHGMSRETMERIFDPFFTTKEPGKGTGMGLSVVHGIVKDCQGAITVSSRPGQGTTFQILLPAVPEQVTYPMETGNPRIPTGDERILFIDDEDELVALGKVLLEHLGYRLTSFQGSLEALEAFRSNPEAYDLVITDQTMPKMTGMELARSMIAIRPDIPIILCSGFSETATIEKARAIGIKEYLMKPLVISQLANAIRQVLDHRGKD
ncbi:MAG: PAS domain-containing hybrid sensor histidine kinase/response regulator [Thermodesulfobacteriota bacterium]